MFTSIKVGYKNKHVTIPEGYRVIKEGIGQKGDMAVDLRTFKFSPLDSDEIGEDISWMDCVIRPIKQKET